MNRRLLAPAVLATLFLLGQSAAPLSAGTFIWTGVGATGWQGDVTPPFDGTDDLILGKAINQIITLSGSPSINSISLTSSDSYLINSQCDNPLTLTLNTGITSTGSTNSTTGLVFDSQISLQGGTGALTMDAGNNGIVIEGHITGSSDLYLVNSAANATGTFIFSDTGSGNDYDSDTYIEGVAGTPVAVAFWNSMPFGYGTIYINNDAEFIAHGSQTVANNVVINTTGTIGLKSWDDTLTFTDIGNTITLNTDAVLAAQRAQQGVPADGNTGIYPTPGPFTRNPIVIAGDIGETGGPRNLTVAGGGVLVLEGNNTYSGGTTGNGSVVFASASSVPASGLITANGGGYVGFADTTSGEFANFLSSHVDTSSSTGAIGIDTLPGNCTVTFSDPIDLTGYNTSLRLGTATSAILTGTITPQGTDYLFGNGGGTLYVQSDLYDLGGSNVILNSNSVVPLTLYLQDAPDYSGNTVADNGFIVFDSYFLPGPGQMIAGGSSINIGASYIGMTDNVDATPTDLINSFDKTNTWGIIGFDTHAGDGTFNVTDDIDLSGFNNGVYLGTSTSAILSGILTPTADNILRLTAAKGGTLEVDSTLGPGSLSPAVVALSIGTPAASDVYSNGTVYLPYANTYTGGTTINSTVGGITLEVGDNNSLGTGPLTLPQNVVAGLQAYYSGIVLPNNVVFQAPTGMNAPASLYITGYNDLELAGTITGPGSITVVNPSVDPTLTLSGNNSGFSGDISLYNSTLVIDNNNAAGTGTLRFLDSGSEVDFSANALNPVIYGLKDDFNDGYLGLYNANALTIDTSNALNDHEFGGEIYDEGTGGSITVTSTSSNDPLYLHGDSDYNGGTFIGTGPTDKAAVAIGTDNALGSGPVTVNTSLQGGFAVNVGVTFTNDLNYTGGTLQGFGTFAPTSVNSVVGGPIIFDAGKAVIPGVYGLGSHNVPGNLTLATGAVFANGGNLLWSLQDVNRTDGHSTLFVDGPNNLNITASSGGFTIYLATLDSTGAPGFANLTVGTPYQFAIATTTGGGLLTNFDPTDFTLDTSMFAGGATDVSVTTDALAPYTDIFINFTPVPEPSTYALLGLGLGAVLFPALRRRRRA